MFIFCCLLLRGEGKRDQHNKKVKEEMWDLLILSDQQLISMEGMNEREGMNDLGSFFVVCC